MYNILRQTVTEMQFSTLFVSQYRKKFTGAQTLTDIFHSQTDTFASQTVTSLKIVKKFQNGSDTSRKISENL